VVVHRGRSYCMMIEIKERSSECENPRTRSSSRRRSTTPLWLVLLITAGLAWVGAIGTCARAIAQVKPTTTLPAKAQAADRSSSAKGAGAAVSPRRQGTSSGTPTGKSTPEALTNPPKTPNVEPVAPAVDGQTVISYLGELINWYRHLQVEERLATEPAEILYVADDRQNANRVLELGFQYADAAAKLVDRASPTLKTTVNSNPATGSAGTSGFDLTKLINRTAEAQGNLASATASVQQLKNALSRARSKQRDVISHQLVTAQAELALAQSQVDALGALVNFERGNSNSASDLQSQIDQLKATVSASGSTQNNAKASPALAAPQPSVPAASGMVGRAEGLLALTQKAQQLDDTIELAGHLLGTAKELSVPLRDAVQQIDQRILKLAAAGGSNDLAVVKDTASEVTQLAAEHKLVLSALMPLSMQTVVVTQYVANLQRWRTEVAQRRQLELRNLLLRAGGLLLLLVGIVAGAALWRRMTFRYVHDIQRRHQLLQLSRIVVVAVIALVLLFDFANQLGALATVMGFAAAGIALTLQNVILSLAGNLYISGRYGIRVGDRVQISGVSGDVIEIGLLKMTLMELSADDKGYLPTGRVTVFPNSVVFQPSGSFSKQLPGSDFAWNELRLTLAPDCDYQLAEQRVVDIVNDVYGRYRDTLQREYRGLERKLNQSIEPPYPQSRLRVSEGGVELIIRYPVQFRNTTQTADEIARRLVDALKREPALKLVTPGTPMIQPVEVVAAQLQSAEKPTEPSAGSNELTPVIDNRAAGGAAAAAAGATVAQAFLETSAAVQEQEGVTTAQPRSR
jgi:small-conductance mechanosensitive channel